MLPVSARLRRMARAMPRRSPLRRYAGAFHRHVGPGAHRDADVGRGERGRVVDAVASHRDDLAATRECFDAGVLVGWRDARLDFIEAELLRHGVGGVLVVAGEHHDF